MEAIGLVFTKKESSMEEVTFIKFEMLIKTDFIQKFFSDLFFFFFSEEYFESSEMLSVKNEKQSSGEKCHVYTGCRIISLFGNKIRKY